MSANVLLTPVGSGGDVHPYIGIGRELRRRGHRVTVLTADPFRDAVERAGLDFAPVLSAELFEEGSSHPDLWHPQKGLAIALELGRYTFDTLWDELDARFTGRDTVVVSHALAFGARAFQIGRTPWSPTVHLAPSVFRSLHRQPILPPDFDPNVVPRPLRAAMWWLADTLFVDRIVRPWLDPAMRARGLPPARRIFGEWMHSERMTLGLFPDWFGDPQPDWPAPTRLTGFPLFDGDADATLSPETVSFLDAGPPPVLFTPGTANRDAADFFRVSIEASVRAGVRAILATGFPEQLPAPLPADVHHTAFEPFGTLLPQCAAIVHHGGVGTTAQGLQAGIPQLVRPLGFDQADNVDRLERLGVGRSIVPDRYRPGAVAQALRDLLADADVATRASELRSRVRGQDGIAAAADAIEETLPAECRSRPRETPAEPAP